MVVAGPLILERCYFVVRNYWCSVVGKTHPTRRHHRFGWAVDVTTINIDYAADVTIVRSPTHTTVVVIDPALDQYGVVDTYWEDGGATYYTSEEALQAAVGRVTDMLPASVTTSEIRVVETGDKVGFLAGTRSAQPTITTPGYGRKVGKRW